MNEKRKAPARTGATILKNQFQNSTFLKVNSQSFQARTAFHGYTEVKRGFVDFAVALCAKHGLDLSVLASSEEHNACVCRLSPEKGGNDDS